jgi:hypothetical protein
MEISVSVQSELRIVSDANALSPNHVVDDNQNILRETVPNKRQSHSKTYDSNVRWNSIGRQYDSTINWSTKQKVSTNCMIKGVHTQFESPIHSYLGNRRTHPSL